MIGQVQFKDIHSLDKVRRLAQNKHASYLLDESGMDTGLRVYGNETVRMFERAGKACALAGRFRNLQYGQLKSSEELKALVGELGYLVVGHISDPSVRILILSSFEAAGKAWERGLIEKRKALKKELESARSTAEKAVRAADKELDEPF